VEGSVVADMFSIEELEIVLRIAKKSLDSKNP
jgi:hypothetical protein